MQGVLPPRELERELDLALAIREAVRAAGPDPARQAEAFARPHRERADTLARELDGWPAQARAHALLAGRPLPRLEEVRGVLIDEHAEARALEAELPSLLARLVEELTGR